MKLTVNLWQALAAILDSIQPKDHANTGEMRKCAGAVEQIRKVIAPQIDEADGIQAEAKKIYEPFQKRLAKLKGDENKLEREELQEEANKKLEKTNEAFRAMADRFSKEEIEIELDQNYKAYIKDKWEEKLRPAFNFRADALKVADAFNIE
ncbi:MAG: hypothetical protein AAB787_01680 [Patescibacteria group bacterium]